MRFGVTIFATDQSMGVAELARAAEDRGFDSIWVPEHTHIPTSRRTLPPTGTAVLDEEYKRTVDPLVSLDRPRHGLPSRLRSNQNRPRTRIDQPTSSAVSRVPWP